MMDFIANYHFLSKVKTYSALLIKEKMNDGITPNEKEIRLLAEVEADFDFHKKDFIDLFTLFTETIYDDWELYKAIKVYYQNLPDYPGLKRGYMLRLLRQLTDEQKLSAGKHLFLMWHKRYKGLTFIFKDPNVREKRKLVGMLGVETVDPMLSVHLKIAIAGTKVQKGKTALSLIQFLHSTYLAQIYSQKVRYVSFKKMGNTHDAVIKRFNDLQDDLESFFKKVGSSEFRRVGGKPRKEGWYRIDLKKKFGNKQDKIKERKAEETNLESVQRTEECVNK